MAEFPVLQKRSSFGEKNDLTSAAATNCAKVRRIHDEVIEHLDQLYTKFEERITKDEFRIVSHYDQKMNIIKEEVSVMKRTFMNLEKDIIGTEEDSEVSRLRLFVKKQWKDIQQLLDLYKRNKEQIQELIQTNNQLKNDHMGCVKRIKCYALENRKLQLALRDVKKSTFSPSDSSHSKDEIDSQNCVSTNEVPDKKAEEGIFDHLKQDKYDKKQVIKMYEEYINKVQKESNNTIQNLKKQLSYAKRTVKQLKEEKLNLINDRSKLEILFLECVEEVRKNKGTVTLPEAKMNIMELFMFNDKLLQILYESTFIRNYIEEALPFINHTKSYRKEVKTRNKSQESHLTNTEVMNGKKLLKANTANEMKIRRQVFNAPVHNIMAKDKNTQLKREKFNGKLYGTKLTIGNDYLANPFLL